MTSLRHDAAAARIHSRRDHCLLAEQLGLKTASAEQLEEHIRSYYTDPAILEFIIYGNDVDREIRLLAQDASRMLQRKAVTDP